MKAILHAGMQKTGSSSIQESLARADLSHSLYTPWRGANHGALVAILFEEGRETLHGALRRYETDPEGLADLRQRTRAKLNRAFKQTQADQVILSAERLFNLAPEFKTRMRDYFAQYCDGVQVICYIRPPASFIQSAFQQMLKSGKLGVPDAQTLAGRWPAYRRHVQGMDRVFGKENVQLVKFDRKTLAQGDVVLDFAHRIGENLTPEDLVRVNETLSLEAASLIFLRGQQGRGRGGSKSVEARRAEKQVIDSLSRVGTGKFALSRALLDPVLEANQADLAWIEERLGDSLAEPSTASGESIETEADFRRIAARARGELEEEIARLEASGPSEPALSILRDISEQAALAGEV